MLSFNKVLVVTTLLISSSLTLFASSPNAKELFTQKCMSCHPITRPADTSQMVAPPAKGLMFHMSQDIGSDDKILKHINSFVMNPTKEKAICRSVRRFGLMPSQEGIITKEELNIVAKWMIANLKMTPEQYDKRKQLGK